MTVTHYQTAETVSDCGLFIKKSSPDDKIIALAGNPNVGKSTIFNALTGMHQHTGNWPGKTVASAVGFCSVGDSSFSIVDLPGTYSLFPHSAEEEVARDFICGGDYDAVIVVCDATCLERNLNLVLQITATGAKTVVGLNLMDEAEKKGIYIDIKKLAALLGVPVIPVIAKQKKGISELLSAADTPEAEKTNAPLHLSPEETVKKAEEIASKTVTFKKNVFSDFDRKADKILTGRILGYPIMLLFLSLILWLTVVGANYPSAALSALFSRIGELIDRLFVAAHLPDRICEMLVSGVFRVVSWVVAVMLPPMAIFFPLFTLLEDLGYLPRIAYNLDKPFKKCCACGKQSLTMCMGFGCNAAGVVGCRIIDSPRERLLAILTNSFVPCNGRFPILISVISMFFVTDGAFSAPLSALILTLVILLGIFATFAATKILSKTILSGVPSSFTLEMPSYRIPKISDVLIRSVFDRTLFVLKRAAAVAAPAGLIIWILANTHAGGASLLKCASDFLDPFAQLFGLDGVILIAFVLGLPANEIVIPIAVMIYLSQGTISETGSLSEMKNLLIANGWNLKTAACVLIFTVLHWPCSTTLQTIKKETGSIFYTALSALLPAAFGFLLCFAVNLVWLHF